MDTITNTCICAINYYQTTADSLTEPPVCEPCPPGSTRYGNTDSSSCSKYGKITILIPSYKYLSSGLNSDIIILLLFLSHTRQFLMMQRVIVSNVLNV